MATSINCLGDSNFPSLLLWISAMKYSALAAVIACLLVSLVDALLLWDICCIVITTFAKAIFLFLNVPIQDGNPSKGFGPVSKEDALQFLEIFGGWPASTIIWFPWENQLTVWNFLFEPCAIQPCRRRYAKCWLRISWSQLNGSGWPLPIR